VGQLLNIYSQGRELFDVDTKESLGTTETLIATIRIDQVMPRISYAKLVEGDLAKITEGQICRPRKVEAVPQPAGQKSEIEKSPTGGIKLPFD
jgi:hypothetical protein